MKRMKKIAAILLTFVIIVSLFSVQAEAAKVKLNKTKATIYVGKSITLKVKGTSKKVKWTSSNKKVATVSSKGKVTGKKKGTVKIKAKIGKKTYQCKVTVKKPIPVPKVAKKVGFDKLIFQDEFDSLDTIDVKATGKKGYNWYVTRPYGESTLEPDDYKVEDGVLTVCNKETSFNYGLGTMDCQTRNGFNYQFGYLEMRLRMPDPVDKNGEGGPAVWSLPPETLYSESHAWVEMDFMEYWGDDCFGTSLHDMEIDENENRWWRRNTENCFYSFGDGDWHVLSYMWVKGSMTCYLDGKVYLKQTWAPGEYPVPLDEVVQGEPGPGAFVKMDSQYLPIFLGGSVKHPLEVDWIRVWQ